MSEPTVSVVMAAWNAESFVAEAVESILGQTFDDFEFIVVDDGSMDGTGAILDAYAARDPRIRLATNDRNLGLIRSLNRSLAMARGRYIVRQDADDVSLPVRIEWQFAFMETHPDVGICGTRVREIGAGAAGVRTYYTEDGELRAALLFRCPFAHPAVILRRQVLDRLSLSYDEAFPQAQDYALWAQVAPHTRLANLPDVLVLYRLHGASVTQRRHAEQGANAARVRRALLKQMDADFTEEEARLHEQIGAQTFCCSRDFVRRAEAWLRKLAETNRRTGAYPEPVFSRVLADEWHYVCDRNSYRSLREGLWSLRTYAASPLAKAAPRSAHDRWKTAGWLAHGPLARRLRGGLRTLFSRPADGRLKEDRP
jgi:glycosyltransferase involved in cell wall biosynthesis